MEPAIIIILKINFGFPSPLSCQESLQQSLYYWPTQHWSGLSDLLYQTFLPKLEAGLWEGHPLRDSGGMYLRTRRPWAVRGAKGSQRRRGAPGAGGRELPEGEGPSASAEDSLSGDGGALTSFGKQYWKELGWLAKERLPGEKADKVMTFSRAEMTVRR